MKWTKRKPTPDAVEICDSLFIQRQNREIKRLRAALRPFAKAGELTRSLPRSWTFQNAGSHEIKIRDLARAYRAYWGKGNGKR